MTEPNSTIDNYFDESVEYLEEEELYGYEESTADLEHSLVFDTNLDSSELVEEVHAFQDEQEISECQWEVVEDIDAVDSQEMVKLQDANVNENKFICEECNQIFSDMDTAQNHNCSEVVCDDDDEQQKVKMPTSEVSNDSTHLQCSNCLQILENMDKLKEHKAKCLTKNLFVYSCSQCNKTYESLRSLNTHSRVHKSVQKATGNNIKFENREIICKICNTSFANEKNFKLHSKMHRNQPIIKTLEDALPAGASLQFSELDQFFCEICNKSFDRNLLTIHRNMHQNLTEYNCNICNKELKDPSSYKMHMSIHNDKIKGGQLPQTRSHRFKGNNSYPCQYCGREFPRPHEKIKHERVHTGEKPYSCEVCGKTFRVQYSLTLHLRTHTDIRPYVCATCNKRFKSHNVYTHHMLTHSNERAYKCNVCPKAFRTAVQLCGHKSTHSKLFSCPICNRPFANLYAVKVHLKTHNKNSKLAGNMKNKYNCSICGAAYERNYALRIHMKQQHDADDLQSWQKLVTNDDGLLMNDNKDAEILLIDGTVSNDRQNEQLLLDGVEQYDNSASLNENEAKCLILETNENILDNFHSEEIIIMPDFK